MGKMSYPRTERKILGQGSNPDKPIRSRAQKPGGYINTCVLVPGLEVLNHIIVSKTKTNKKPTWNDTITLVQ